MKWVKNIIAVTAGIALGQMLISANKSHNKDSDKTTINAKQNHRSSTRDSRLNASQIIRHQSDALHLNISHKAAIERLRNKNSSPLRSRSFLSYRINTMSQQALIQDLADGHIRTHEELRQAAKRLTMDDHETTWDLIRDHKIKADGMDSFYVFTVESMKVMVKKDPEWLLQRFKTYRRGGSQQENTLYFSNIWAKHDPKAAADHFNDLVYMRNMTGGGSKNFGHQQFANQIVQSWISKDKEGLFNYIEQLPQSIKRNSLEQAASKLTENTN